MPDKWRLLLPEQIDEAGPRSISDIVDSSIEYSDTDDIRTKIDEADAIIHRGVRIDAELIERADRLKVISKHGVGLDSIDIEAATARDVVVCNTPQTSARAVAEAAITLVLATRRNIVQADTAVREGDWNARTDWDRFCRSGVKGDTLGLFGFGNIAQEVAKIGLGMGMTCVTYDPYIDDQAVFKGVTRVEEKQQLFEASDMVSVHAPLTDGTHHAVGYDELQQIDYIINTSRGGIVEENDLLRALDENLVAAGLDVLEEEPPSPENPLIQRDDVILSPHIGNLSTEAMRETSIQAAKNVRTVYEGELPESSANAEHL